MAAHSSTLAWKILWTEEPGRLQSDTTEQLHFHFSFSCIGEGNGKSLQCSCLENPRDAGAWWAAIYGVTQSWTRMKQLSGNSSSSSRNGVLYLSLKGWNVKHLGKKGSELDKNVGISFQRLHAYIQDLKEREGRIGQWTDMNSKLKKTKQRGNL